MRHLIPLTRFITLLFSLGLLTTSLNATEILWSQYCQHLGKMKLLVHLDTDPTTPVEGDPETVTLSLRDTADDEWETPDFRGFLLLASA